MKNLFVAAALVSALMVSCTKESQNVTPTSPGHSTLSVIVPKTGSSGNLLLLKNGTLANPVSGIPSFSSMRVGQKLSLQYVTTADSSTTNPGVVTITVTKYTDASDSVFVPQPQPKDTTTFSGYFVVTSTRVHTPDSLQSVRDTTYIHFSGANYTTIHSTQNLPTVITLADGSGTFAVDGGSITFTDTSANSAVAILNGQYSYYTSQGNIFLWANGDGYYYSVTLRRNN